MKKLLFWMILVILGAVGGIVGSFVGSVSFLLWIEERYPETGKRLTEIVKRFVSDGTIELFELLAYGDKPRKTGPAHTTYVPYNRPTPVPDPEDPEAKEG